MAETPLQSRAHKVLQERWERLGFDRLSQLEQDAIALYWLEAEVMNGGLHQFFSNSSGDLSELVISGLSRLGATETLSLFQAAVAKLGVGSRLRSREARVECLRRLGPNAFDTETPILEPSSVHSFRAALTGLATYYAAGHA